MICLEKEMTTNTFQQIFQNKMRQSSESASELFLYPFSESDEA